MSFRPFNSLVIVLAILGIAASEARAAVTYAMREVMSGLVTPRGMALGPDGALYVAEAGRGGTGPSVVLGNGATAFLGDTSGVSRLLGGVQQRVISGLPSIATAAGLDASGLQDIAFDPMGQAYGLFAFGSEAAQRDSNLGAVGANLGRIVKLPLSGPGVIQPVADIAAHEQANNPAGGARDSNPFGFAITPNGDFVVADAGANAFVNATAAGVVTTLGVLAARPNPLPFGPPVFQSVPTSIAIGPDGAYYIGQLTGFPFPPGAANVYRYDPTTDALSIAYSGFTNIIDLTFDADGDLLVLQLTTNGLASSMGPGPGLLLKIDADTGERSTIASAGLIFPGGVLAAPDGTIYVTNRTNTPDGGQVLAFNAVPEPASWMLWSVALALVAVGRRVVRRSALSS